MRQAVLREMERGGQVFFVHNRIGSIDLVRMRLEDIVPEARVITAHGQMGERHLESVIAEFARGEYDILLSTAIIENGIDMPNVNTVIVDRADWFGLSQLYQIRGRVGRGAQQAYAYFFYDSGKLTHEAFARLETLAEHTKLGAGLQIAMRDLEIRGAGDILSTRQTGQVAAVGLTLYTQLLAQAVNHLKGNPDDTAGLAVSAPGMVIDLPIPAYLPDDWIRRWRCGCKSIGESGRCHALTTLMPCATNYATGLVCCRLPSMGCSFRSRSSCSHSAPAQPACRRVTPWCASSCPTWQRSTATRWRNASDQASA
ncbi:MAG: hypothetical protein HND48_08205 [Chloroflexi bacterium]|nr:hypothetical protein [Chloroflexota bacterium]